MITREEYQLVFDQYDAVRSTRVDDGSGDRVETRDLIEPDLTDADSRARLFASHVFAATRAKFLAEQLQATEFDVVELLGELDGASPRARELARTMRARLKALRELPGA